jgi:hypothetical protein
LNIIYQISNIDECCSGCSDCGNYEYEGGMMGCQPCNKNDKYKYDCIDCQENEEKIVEWTEWESNLMLTDTKSWETSCGITTYPEYTVNVQYEIHNRISCQAWTGNWYQWANDGAWLSWQRSFYLQIDGHNSFGNWIPKSDTNANVNVFVKPGNMVPGADGSYNSPFNNIVKALSYANDQAAPHNSAVITIILLGGGDHVMHRQFSEYTHQHVNKDPYSYNQDITIQPAFWGETIGGHSFGANDDDWIEPDSKITVYYQMGSSFMFTVPKSLTVKSISFDALDSSIDPQNDCLLQNHRCCTLTNTTMENDETNPSTETNCTMYAYQSEDCYTTNGHSLFKFGYIDSVSLIDEVGTLTIQNCQFQHFFYDFTTLIEFVNGYGHVVIRESVFTKFSTCGSIIRDVRELPSQELEDDDMKEYKQRRATEIFRQNVIKTHYTIQPSTAWNTTECASIQIYDSTFSNFNYMKSDSKYMVI